MLVIKADGSKEQFDKKKIIRTCSRSGASKKNCILIANKIEKSLYEGITTKEIYQKTLKELDSLEPKSSINYKLREAVSKIPSKKFEIYSKKILEAYNYKCEWNVIIKGASIEHQVDLIAKKDKTFLIECKHHKNPHRMSGLGEILQIYARLLDIQDGYKQKKNKYNFSQAWLITNTKISWHARKYSKAKNIILTGWNYPDTNNLAKLIVSKKVYPITVLKMNEEERRKLMHKNIITIQDILEKPESVNKSVLNQIDEILKNNNL